MQPSLHPPQSPVRAGSEVRAARRVAAMLLPAFLFLSFSSPLCGLVEGAEEDTRVVVAGGVAARDGGLPMSGAGRWWPTLAWFSGLVCLAALWRDAQSGNMPASGEPSGEEQSSKELQLQQQRDILNQFVENTPAAVAMFDRQMRFLAASRRWRTDYRLGNIQLVGRSHYDVFPEITEEWKDLHRRCLQGESLQCDEEAFQRADGRIDWIRWEILPWRNSAGEIGGIVMFTESITEQIEARDLLRESEARFRTLIEHAPEAVVVVDYNTGRFVEANRNAVEMFGMSREELLQVGPAEVSPPRQPDGRPSSEAAATWIHQAVHGQAPEFEWVHLGAGGRELICEIRLVRLPGKLSLLRGSVLDITERKQAEAELAQTVRELADKNAELERFTYTVSHDLKSPLVTIKGFAAQLEASARAGEWEQFEGDLRRIHLAADRMKQLLDELLALSRLGRVINPVERVSLRSLALEAVENCSGAIQQRGVVVDVSPGLPDVLGDRGRLRMVMQNLIDNAVKFLGDQPAPRIEIGQRNDSGESVIFVRDNGVGIDPSYQEKLFGLFEKLDKKSIGSGVGLASCRRIVEVHGGRIWIESPGLGKGATICFTVGSGGGNSTARGGVEQ